MASYLTLAILSTCLLWGVSADVSYSGHKVLTVVPRTNEELNLLKKLRSDYGVDLWNEPNYLNSTVMMRLEPNLQESVFKHLKSKKVEHFTAFEDLQAVIEDERIQHSPSAPNRRDRADAATFDFGMYHQLSEVTSFIQQITQSNSHISKVEVAGQSYENRPIHLVKITSGPYGTKPIIMIECGIHAREWSSVAACLYLINELITKSDQDPVKNLLSTYEFLIVPEANPDGYLYTWTQDRLWRKTRSRSNLDWLGNCLGADANRNFDIHHCGVGTSRKPCEEIYCGDAPFSESESRALRDLMVKFGSKTKAYFSLHAFSQYWMTPYAITKRLPENYQEQLRIATIGANALRQRYGTPYRVGSLANVIYEAAGSSVDYAYEVQKIKLGFALELRDQGRFGFFLPKQMILPMCEETTDGLLAAFAAI